MYTRREMITLVTKYKYSDSLGQLWNKTETHYTRSMVQAGMCMQSSLGLSDPIVAIKWTVMSASTRLRTAREIYRDSNGDIDMFTHPTKPKGQLTYILLVIYVKPSGRIQFPVKKINKTSDLNFWEFWEIVAQTTSQFLLPPSQ